MTLRVTLLGLLVSAIFVLVMLRMADTDANAEQSSTPLTLLKAAISESSGIGLLPRLSSGVAGRLFRGDHCHWREYQ